MNITRRSFLATLASLPWIGRFLTSEVKPFAPWVTMRDHPEIIDRIRYVTRERATDALTKEDWT